MKTLAFLIAAFILSRLLYYYAGVRFDAGPLTTQMQYFDVELLRNNLLQSLFYLHTQPPLFNLFLGLMVKLFPHHTAEALGFSYLMFGLVLSVSLFLLMTRLGVSDKIAALLTLWFVISPACILYENYLFYTYPITALLCLSALALHSFMSRPSFQSGFVFFMLLSTIALARSLFHLFWFVLFAAMVLLCLRPHWRKVLAATCVPFLLIFFWYAKNLCLFGSFTSSTWFGMSFSKLTTDYLPDAERKALVSQGKISKLSLLQPYSCLEEYEPYLPEIKETHVPVLDQKLKSTPLPDPKGKNYNWNYVGYIYLSRQYMRDARYVLLSHPRVYMLSLARAYCLFFHPANNYGFLRINRVHIQRLNRLWNIVFFGQIIDTSEATGPEPDHSREHYLRVPFKMGLFLMIAFLGLSFYGLRLMIEAFRRKPVDWPFAGTVLFLCINILYVALVGNCFEVGENNRFRFKIDPFLLVLLGLFLSDLFRHSLTRKNRTA